MPDQPQKFDPLGEGAVPDSQGFDPISEGALPDLPTEGSSQQPGILSRAWSAFTSPLAPLGEKILQYERPIIGGGLGRPDPALEDAKLNEVFSGLGTARSWARGLEEGYAPEVSQMYTSPAGILGTASGLSEAPLAKSAIEAAQLGNVDKAAKLWQGAKLANATRRAVAAPFAVHGAMGVVNQPTALGKLGSFGEMVGGALGAQGGLKPPSSIQVKPPEVTVEPPRAPGNLLGDISAPGTTPGETVPPPPFTEGEFKEAPPKYTSPRSDEVPVYYTTSGKHEPSFANDVDRAMWMVSELRPSKKYTEYLDFVKKTTGLPTERARQMSVDFGKYVKDHLKKAGPGITPVPETYGSEEWNKPPEAQMMRVPGTNPETGRPNIAMGGASSRVLQILGGNMYSGNRAATVTKELLQNAEDEHKIAGVTASIKVNIDNNATNPQTREPVNSVTVQDSGRGLTPDQLYTKFSDLGESGKTTEANAAGGFGFAKAAPMLSGEYVDIESVVAEQGSNVKYTFSGNPKELINQSKGVPLQGTPTDEPTGLKVTTYFPKSINTQYADIFARSFAKDSHNVSPIELTNDFGTSSYTPKPIPPLRGTINVPGATVNLHYDDYTGTTERESYMLDLLNKGLYQHASYMGYGAPLPKVPYSIQANIIPTVEEEHPDYPFSTNREQIKTGVRSAITDWVKTNIAEDLLRRRREGTQRAYDNIRPLISTGAGKIVHFYDPGERFTPTELQQFATDPHLQQIAGALDVINDVMLAHADQLEWKHDMGGINPSQKLKKFGLLAHKPADTGTGVTFGVHIPNPSNPDESSISIGLFELLNSALKKPDPLDQLSTGLYATIAHEVAHIPGGSHDVSHSYRDAALRSSIGAKTNIKILTALNQTLGDKNGQIKPELLRLLNIYEQSRLRAPSTNDTLLDTGIEHARPTNTQGGERPSEKRRGQGTSYDTYRRAIAARELYELPRGLTASWDLSAPLRQGKWLVGTKEWRSAFGKMISAASSEGNYDAVMQYIEGIPVVKNGVAYRAGLHLTDLSNQPSRREEFLRSVWAETGEFLPKELQKGYKNTLGTGVRASNRAYTAFLNALRAEYFQKMYDYMPKDKRNDWNYIKAMAQFVNDATGRGKYELGIGDYHIPIGRGGLSLPTKIDLEHLSPGFNFVLYAGRNMMSNARMLNPGTYIHLPPQIRNEYLMSLLRYAGMTAMVMALYKMKGAKVSTDPRSSDFLKARFGNIRMDPGSGNQQIMVLASRLASGYYKSSTSGKQYELGKGFKATTRKDVYEDFLANKLHPWWRFAYDLMDASAFKPFSPVDRTLQLFIPMVVGDLAAIYKSDPSLMALILPATFGQGAQTYEKGTDNPVFTPVIADALGKNPEDVDMKFKGGPIPKVGKYMNQVLDKMSRYGDRR